MHSRSWGLLASATVNESVALVAVFWVVMRMGVRDPQISQNLLHRGDRFKRSPAVSGRLLQDHLQGTVNFYLTDEMAVFVGYRVFRFIDHRGSSILLETGGSLFPVQDHCRRVRVSGSVRDPAEPRGPMVAASRQQLSSNVPVVDNVLHNSTLHLGELLLKESQLITQL
jgi:hypothetical protein